MNRSPLYQLVEARLGGSLEDLVTEARPPRVPRATWAEIAAQIGEKTGIELSGETLRLWFVESERQSA